MGKKIYAYRSVFDNLVLTVSDFQKAISMPAMQPFLWSAAS